MLLPSFHLLCIRLARIARIARLVLYRVFQNIAPPSPANLAEPWVTLILVPCNTTNLKIIYQGLRIETTLFGIGSAFC